MPSTSGVVLLFGSPWVILLSMSSGTFTHIDSARCEAKSSIGAGKGLGKPLFSRDFEHPVRISKSGYTWKSTNFDVIASNVNYARVVATEAEYQREVIAKELLGGGLTLKGCRCTIDISEESRKILASSEFAFTTSKDGASLLKLARFTIHCDLSDTLLNVIPHEVCRYILASYIGNPLPRYLDEGVAASFESDETQAIHVSAIRKKLEDRSAFLQSRIIFMSVLVDIPDASHQAHSLVSFLLSEKHFPMAKPLPDPAKRILDPAMPTSYRRLMSFLAVGMEDNKKDGWNLAARSVYGYESIDAMHEAWLKWIKRRH
jgi:hypothetical protein